MEHFQRGDRVRQTGHKLGAKKCEVGALGTVKKANKMGCIVELDTVPDGIRFKKLTDPIRRAIPRDCLEHVRFDP